jgi:LPXTG-motif cell wall-anchored protein
VAQYFPHYLTSTLIYSAAGVAIVAAASFVASRRRLAAH